VVAAALVLWVATLVVLWPVLDANYRGLPPSTARLVAVLGLLVYYAIYGAILVLTYRFVTRRPGDAVAAGAELTRPPPVPSRFRPWLPFPSPSRSHGGRSSPPPPGSRWPCPRLR
jgi:hypothetical protein